MIDLAELEALSAVLVRNGCGGSCVTTSDDVLEIITRLRQAEKDAARYRWLRDTADVAGTTDLMISIIISDDWDLLIDEAMQCNLGLGG